MADENGNREAFRIQEHYCTTHGAPIVARVCAALADGLSRDSRTGARALDWRGEPTRDALPLRLVGGLHGLARSGKAPKLAQVFAGAITDTDKVQAIVEAALIDDDAALLPWLDGPPQTNEPGRAGALMAGLIEVARRYGPRIELLEIGSSAGLNLLIDRYRFDLGGTVIGPEHAEVTIRPQWRGPPPPAVPVEILSVRGADIQPIDVTAPGAAERLAAYVWADAPERLDRLERTIAMIHAEPVRLECADAADWIEARLAEPQAEGVTRVLMHSVVWQYLGPEGQARITAAMQAAGAQATAELPLAWVRMEPDRALAQMEIWVRSWPYHPAPQRIALSHAHGAWVEAVDVSS